MSKRIREGSRATIQCTLTRTEKDVIREIDRRWKGVIKRSLVSHALKTKTAEANLWMERGKKQVHYIFLDAGMVKNEEPLSIIIFVGTEQKRNLLLRYICGWRKKSLQEFQRWSLTRINFCHLSERPIDHLPKMFGNVSVSAAAAGEEVHTQHNKGNQQETRVATSSNRGLEELPVRLPFFSFTQTCMFGRITQREGS